MTWPVLPPYSAVWWRSDVKIEGNVIVPVPPYEDYNPFGHYWPVEVGGSRRKSLPYKFLAVDSADPEAVAAFCREHGVIGMRIREEEWLDQKAIDTLVKLTPKEQLMPGTVEWDLRDRLAWGSKWPPPGFMPMPLEEFRHRQVILDRAMAWAELVKANPLSDKGREALELLRVLLNGKLEMVRPRLEWQTADHRWAQAWDVVSLEGAMYLMLYFDLQGRGLIRSCKECRQKFLATRAWSTFCSLKCKGNFTQREYERRKKVESLRQEKQAGRRTDKGSGESKRRAGDGAQGRKR